MGWTRFMDMHSGGDLKLPPYTHIYIESDREGYVRPAGDEKCVALTASWCGTEQRNANGRLMAASKDLYDAAVAARKALQGLPGHYSYCRMCPRPGPYTELIADLTKAIAKADQS